MRYDSQDDHEKAMKDGLRALGKGTKLVYKRLVKPTAKAGLKGLQGITKKRKKSNWTEEA